MLQVVNDGLYKRSMYHVNQIEAVIAYFVHHNPLVPVERLQLVIRLRKVSLDLFWVIHVSSEVESTLQLLEAELWYVQEVSEVVQELPQVQKVLELGRIEQHRLESRSGLQRALTV